VSAPFFSVGPAVGRADVPVLSERLVALLRDTPADVVICDVGAITDPDASTLEVLARLQLMARRLGCGMRLHGASGRLRALLAVTGLSEVLPLEHPTETLRCAPRLGGDPAALERERQAEEREEAVDVEEVVDPVDPAV
jgi:anti-anti-sigma regulatory factor